MTNDEGPTPGLSQGRGGLTNDERVPLRGRNRTNLSKSNKKYLFDRGTIYKLPQTTSRSILFLFFSTQRRRFAEILEIKRGRECIAVDALATSPSLSSRFTPLPDTWHQFQPKKIFLSQIDYRLQPRWIPCSVVCSLF